MAFTATIPAGIRFAAIAPTTTPARLNQFTDYNGTGNAAIIFFVPSDSSLNLNS